MESNHSSEQPGTVPCFQIFLLSEMHPSSWLLPQGFRTACPPYGSVPPQDTWDTLSMCLYLPLSKCPCSSDTLHTILSRVADVDCQLDRHIWEGVSRPECGQHHPMSWSPRPPLHHHHGTGVTDAEQLAFLRGNG